MRSVSGCAVVVVVSCVFFVASSLSQKVSCSIPRDQEGPSDSAVIRALVDGNQSLARQLVEAGASPNRKDRFGTTPIDVAISMHFADLVEFFVQKGADVNLTDGKGASPLMSAAWSCDVTIAKFLLKQGAKADHRDLSGETPLSYSAGACKDGEMTKLLIAFGGKINAKDKFGDTPISVAAFSGNEAAVRELIQAGADLSVKNDRGEVAETRACDRRIGRNEGNDKVCSILREASRR